MAFSKTLLALGLIAAAAPASAGAADRARPEIAPPGDADTLYCMKVEPMTGSRIERIMCWTRDHWAEQGVDVDKDWPKEGVRIIG